MIAKYYASCNVSLTEIFQFTSKCCILQSFMRIRENEIGRNEGGLGYVSEAKVILMRKLVRK